MDERGRAHGIDGRVEFEASARGDASPVRATEEGTSACADDLPIPVVTIPRSEYAALLEAKRRIDIIDARERRYPVPPRSPIQADAEIADFFKERFGKDRMEDIVRECARRFGKDRTPSRTAAYAFWKRLREGRSE